VNITITIPLKIVSEANQREHWAPKRRRRRAQQETMLAHLLAYKDKLPPFPVSVQFTRYGIQPLDNDNLTGAFKHVRDEIASFYKVDDGDPRWKWHEPKQVRTKHKSETGISVELTALASQAPQPRPVVGADKGGM
jgi:hypothetical protein